MEPAPVPPMDAAEHPDMFIPKPVYEFIPRFRRCIHEKVCIHVYTCIYMTVYIYTCIYSGYLKLTFNCVY